VFKPLLRWLGKFKQRMAISDQYDERVASIRRDYACDFCRGNCGQCGISVGRLEHELELAKQWYRQEWAELDRQYADTPISLKKI